MDNVFKNCVTCLNKNYLTNINEMKNGISSYEKIKICIPQIVSDKYNMQQGFLCINCRSFINNFYQFFINCMKSKNIIESMIVALKKENNDLCEDQPITINIPQIDDFNVSENENEIEEDNKDGLELCLDTSDNTKELVESDKHKNEQIIIEFIDVECSNVNVENDEKTKDEPNDVSNSNNKNKEKYICNECGKVFSQIWNLKSHIKYVHAAENQSIITEPEFIEIDSKDILSNLDDTGKYRCKKCGKTCTRIWHLKSHIKYKHNTQREFRCTLCDKEFVEMGNLRKHLHKHKDQYKYQCDKCKFRFLTEDELTMHKNLLRCYLKEKIKCKYCNSYFHRESALNRHMNIRHIKEKQSMCKLCGKSFLKSSSLQVHMKNMHGGKEIICEICNKKFATNGILNKHLKLHFNDGVKYRKIAPKKTHNFKEEIIQDSTDETEEIMEETTEELLEEIMEEISEENKDIRDDSSKSQCHLCGILYSGSLQKHLRTHPNEKPYKCEICPCQFYEKRNLTSHIRRVHDREKNHICHICGKTFFCKRSLEKHIHHHEDTEIYSCDICEKKFKDNNNLKRHNLLIHLGGFPKKFECKVCNLKVWSNVDLIRHMRTHTGEKPYMCEICGKRFAIKRQVTVHYNFSHATTRPYLCGLCNKRFATQNCLNVHMKLHSQIRPYKCEYCSKSFKHKYHIQRHLKNGACKNYTSAVPDDDLIRMIDKTQ